MPKKRFWLKCSENCQKAFFGLFFKSLAAAHELSNILFLLTEFEKNFKKLS